MNIAIIVVLLICCTLTSTEDMTDYMDSANVFHSTAILQELSLVEMRMVKLQLKLHQSVSQLNVKTKIITDKFTNQTGVDLSDKKKGDLHEKKLKDSVLHPINAYQLIKRTYTLFNDVKKYTQKTIQKLNGVLNLVNSYQDFGATPTRSDLVGAADSLMRLVESYQLNPVKFTHGILEGQFDSKRLKGEFEERKHVNQLDSEDVSFLIEVANGLGNRQRETFWREVLKLRKSYAANESKEDEMHTLKDENELGAATTHITFPITDKVEQNIKKISEQLCRGVTLQSPEYQKRLKCYHETHSSPYLLLMPLKVEELFISPRIVIFRNFLTIKQRNYFIETSIDFLQSSVVQHSDKSSTPSRGRQSMSTIIGKQMKPLNASVNETERLNYSDEDAFLTSLNKKIEEATQLRVNTPFAAEPYSTTNYGIGGFYKIHHDFSYQKTQWGGRIATFLMYLTDVEAGGSTVFPHLGVSSPPSAGSALFWYSTNARGNKEDLMAHKACPVLHGNKWITTKWIHRVEQFRTRPCGLDREEKL